MKYKIGVVGGGGSQRSSFTSSENIRSARTALGLEIKYYDDVIGKRYRSKIALTAPINLNMIK